MNMKKYLQVVKDLMPDQLRSEQSERS